MPDDGALPHGTGQGAGMRGELLREAEAALTRLGPALPPAAAGILHALAEGMPVAELAGLAPETLAAEAASLFSLAETRKPGEPRIRVTAPGGPSGVTGRGAGAVVEVVMDDMPFLVDSALAALTLSGRTVRRLLHPILGVARDAAGRLRDAGPAVPGGPNESMMRIEVAPGAARRMGPGAPAPADWPGVEAALVQAMTEVRVAVSDFAPMLDRLTSAEGEIAALPDGAEAAAFLRWLGEGNFVLLGHRLLRLTPTGPVAEDGLGLLRDDGATVFDALRDMSAVPPAVSEALAQPIALTIAKANVRVRVHRPSYADVIATRVLGADGRVTGVRLFFGLFAATAYNRSPRGIPWLNSKVARVLKVSGAAPDTHDARAFQSILDTWPRDELFQATEEEILAGARVALDLTIRPRPALALRPDPFGRFVSAIVWMPREGFDTRLRERVGRLLASAYGGRLSAFYIALGDSPLARVHYVIGTTPGASPEVDAAALEAAITRAARGFPDALADALAEGVGEAEGARLAARWADAFPLPTPTRYRPEPRSPTCGWPRLRSAPAGPRRPSRACPARAHAGSSCALPIRARRCRWRMPCRCSKASTSARSRSSPIA
ncbi:hypothetical protein ACE7GA_09105 [Roseomonas sp. CCTCC AB2023176]|uniref:hypothetical protein n=1 Tax=Roseomonas sp. CCTCC AB2023176 TaxID=3342640 RepID=UPI0035DAA02C